MNIPQGWSIDTKDSKKYNASIDIPLLDNDGSKPPKKISLKVDNTTGEISIVGSTEDFGDNVPFYNYDPKSNKWTVPDLVNSDATYQQILKEVGTDGLKFIEDNAKTGSSKVIQSTSSEEDKSKISETDGYKSTLANTGEEGSETISSVPDSNLEIIGEPEKYEDYTYPIKMSETTLLHQDTIEFKQFKYGKLPRNLNLGGEFGSVGQREGFTIIQGSVVLAIPTGIRDSNRVNWQDDSENVFGLELAKISLSAMNDPSGTSKTALSNLSNALSNPQIQESAKTAIAGQAGGTNNALARFNGAIVNPNLELLFGGPSLRDFAYTIEMTPRSKEEAVMIRNIIRYFKRGMATRRAKGGLYLQAPNAFSIRYLYKNNEDHPYINMVKKYCALRECSIDYTPQNTYMTHSEDGSMIAYKMTLQFTELEPVYYDDYDDTENTMGY